MQSTPDVPDIATPECALALSVWGAPALVSLLAWFGVIPTALAGPSAGASLVLVALATTWCANRS